MPGSSRKSIYTKAALGGGDPDPLLRLGAALVEELGLDERSDTLTKWMAHYVAQCIAEARAAGAKTRAKANQRCHNAILALWAHRAELPGGCRPLAAIEPLVALLQSLDPEKPRGYYLRHVWDSIDASPPAADTAVLAEIRNLDWAARLLIDMLLRAAAAGAADVTQPWIELATGAQLGNGPDIDLVLHLAGDDEPALAESNRRFQLASLREKHAALIQLSEQAHALAEVYAREIELIEGAA